MKLHHYPYKDRIGKQISGTHLNTVIGKKNIRITMAAGKYFDIYYCLDISYDEMERLIGNYKETLKNEEEKEPTECS